MMKTIMSYRLAAISLAVLLSTAFAAADDGGNGGGDHSSDHSSGGSASDGAGDGGSGSSGGGRSFDPSSASVNAGGSGGPLALGDRDGDEAVDADQDQARELVEHGIIRPLRDILRQVRNEAPGDVVGVDLRRRSGRWVYGLKVLTPAGKRVEIAVDAGTMAILPVRQ